MSRRDDAHDPLFWLFDTLRALACNFDGDHKTAIDWADRAIRRPGAVRFWPFAHMASSWGHLGNSGEAQRAIEQARKGEPRFSYAFMREVMPFGKHERVESYFEGLCKAGLDIPDEPAEAD